MEQGIDVLMVPINGRDLERHARGIVGNMDSREACWFGAEIGADLVIPLHYDMIGGETRRIRWSLQITWSVCILTESITSCVWARV